MQQSLISVPDVDPDIDENNEKVRPVVIRRISWIDRSILNPHRTFCRRFSSMARPVQYIISLMFMDYCLQVQNALKNQGIRENR
jgi:threonyl-tRNA synthetase